MHLNGPLYVMVGFSHIFGSGHKLAKESCISAVCSHRVTVITRVFCPYPVVCFFVHECEPSSSKQNGEFLI